jgi:hypothetical protein
MERWISRTGRILRLVEELVLRAFFLIMLVKVLGAIVRGH